MDSPLSVDARDSDADEFFEEAIDTTEHLAVAIGKDQENRGGDLNEDFTNGISKFPVHDDGGCSIGVNENSTCSSVSSSSDENLQLREFRSDELFSGRTERQDKEKSPASPAGLGESSLRTRSARVNSAPTTAMVKPPSVVDCEIDETREKLQMIRVKFLRIAKRFGQTPHNVVVAQVLYRIGLAEQIRGGSAGGGVARFSFDRASAIAERMESDGHGDGLDFSCTVMVIGKAGVGKSATANSIFDEAKLPTDAFRSGTKRVSEVAGTVNGIGVRVIDTPGLLPSTSDQCRNARMLRSAKRFARRTPPDIVLYLDRLDVPDREFGDAPILRTITDVFGPSIWFSAIVGFTHAGAAPPESPNGAVSSYDMFVTQRSHAVQQAIRVAAGDARLMNPVSLVENHSSCRTNRAGQRVLPNGQVWKPHLLLLSFASKILAEASTLLKLQDGPPPVPLNLSKAPPLPFLLTSFLQPRPHGDGGTPEENIPIPASASAAGEDGGCDVSVPDLPIPASFDSDCPAHRYRSVAGSWLIRPVIDSRGWDRDVGYDGISVEKSFTAVPVSVSGQVSKDKKDASLQVEVTGSFRSAVFGADVQTVGKEMACTLRGESRLGSFLGNVAAGGASVTVVGGDVVSAGVKVEDRLVVGKRLQVVATAGGMRGRRGDVAYGGTLEAALRDRDFPLGRSLSTVGLSVMDWHGEVAVGFNIQSQIAVGQSTNAVARASLNNRGSGQIAIKLTTSDQLHIVLLALFPLLRKLVGYCQNMLEP